MDWVAWGTWAGTVCEQHFGPTTLRSQSPSVRMLVRCPALHAFTSIAYTTVLSPLCGMFCRAELPLLGPQQGGRRGGGGGAVEGCMRGSEQPVQQYA